MLSFMVIGLPRSGTTWAANWLTTDKSVCHHDPLYHTHYTDWDSVLWREATYGEFTGVSCTGIWRWVDWLNAHPAPKLILHRSLGEQLQSLDQHHIHIPSFGRAAESLYKIQGLHLDGEELWLTVESAQEAWARLLPKLPFNQARWKLLSNMRIEPAQLDRGVDQPLQHRLRAELC